MWRPDLLECKPEWERMRRDLPSGVCGMSTTQMPATGTVNVARGALAQRVTRSPPMVTYKREYQTAFVVPKIVTW